VNAPVWQLLALSLVATVVVGVGMFAHVVRTNGGMPALLSAGTRSRGAEVIQRDFPSYHVPETLAGPGQLLYVVAREPTHLGDAARHLDRPRYRLQAILLPVLAWLVHPVGGGRGLVLAMWLVASFGIVLCGLGGSLLAQALGASPRASRCLAVVIPVLPASLAVLALTTADGLALGLALLALACDARSQKRLACSLAVLAVFAQAAALLVLVGWVIWRGRPAVARMFVVPTAFAIGWSTVLWVWFSSSDESLREFSPLIGLARSLHAWVLGDDRIAAATFAIAVLVALAALARHGLRSPFGPMIVVQVGLLAMLAATSLAGDWNAIRATGPLLVIGAIGSAVPSLRAPAKRRI
jgi:hypothetical protein